MLLLPMNTGHRCLGRSSCLTAQVDAGACTDNASTILSCGLNVSHAGGAAHSFKVGGYTFDAGPSFHMGLADPPGTSSNPLAQVLQLLDEQVECKRYSQVRLGQG